MEKLITSKQTLTDKQTHTHTLTHTYAINLLHRLNLLSKDISVWTRVRKRGLKFCINDAWWNWVSLIWIRFWYVLSLNLHDTWPKISLDRLLFQKFTLFSSFSVFHGNEVKQKVSGWRQMTEVWFMILFEIHWKICWFAMSMIAVTCIMTSIFLMKQQFNSNAPVTERLLTIQFVGRHFLTRE